MTPLTALWLPIVLSAVIVFVARDGVKRLGQTQRAINIAALSA